MQAVITGDIVNSTRLAAAKEKKLRKVLTDLFRNARFEFYRGDSFQVFLKNPLEALRLALLCRTAAISMGKGDKTTMTDIRLSIGVGMVNAPVRELRTSGGEAFLLSGRSFDEIAKTGRHLAITTGNALANEGLQVISDYLNAIFKAMSGKQAEVIYEMLNGEMQQAVAKKFKKTKSTIHQRLISGHWPEIENLLQHYENIIKQLS